MRRRIWKLLLRTMFKIIIFIGLNKQDRNQQQLPCTIITITQNQLKYLRKKFWFRKKTVQRTFSRPFYIENLNISNLVSINK